MLLILRTGWTPRVWHRTLVYAHLGRLRCVGSSVAESYGATVPTSPRWSRPVCDRLATINVRMTVC